MSQKAGLEIGARIYYTYNSKIKPMKHSFLYDTDAAILAMLLFILMFVAIKIGYSLGLKRTKIEAGSPGIPEELKSNF